MSHYATCCRLSLRLARSVQVGQRAATGPATATHALTPIVNRVGNLNCIRDYIDESLFTRRLLLRLADKYQCNDLLAACRAFLTDRVLPELAACRDASAAAVRRKLRLVLETASIAQRCNLDGVAGEALDNTLGAGLRLFT